MTNQALKVNLNENVTLVGSDFSKFGCLHLIVKAGCSFSVRARGGSVHGEAINGTQFSDETTVRNISANSWGNFKAPDDADVEVIVEKYHIGDFTVTSSNTPYQLVVKDIFAFDYMGAETTIEPVPFFQSSGTIDMNNKPFGYMPTVGSIGAKDGDCKILNFNWESEDNGLTSKNFPNLTFLAVVPDVPVPITAYSRLLNATISLKSETGENYTTGSVEDLGNAFLANGRTTNFGIISNGKITLNGSPVGWNKTVRGTYNEGTYSYSIVS